MTRLVPFLINFLKHEQIFFIDKPRQGRNVRYYLNAPTETGKSTVFIISMIEHLTQKRQSENLTVATKSMLS